MYLDIYLYIRYCPNCADNWYFGDDAQSRIRTDAGNRMVAVSVDTVLRLLKNGAN